MIIRMPNFKGCGGLIPVVVQDKETKDVLMVAFTKEAQFLETFETGEAVFYSRSRKKRWKKGEEKSGNVLKVHDMRVNCNGDSLLYVVTQKKKEAGFCHTGEGTCFFRSITQAVVEDDSHTTAWLFRVGI